MQPLPKLVGRGRGFRAGGRVGIVNHIPGHAAWHRLVERAFHADRFSLATGEATFHAPRHSGDGKVVADDGNSCSAHGADHRFQVFQLGGFFRTVEQHIVPMRGIEIFDRFQFEAGGVNFALQRRQFFVGPEFVRIAGQSPAGIVAARLIAELVTRGAEVIDQMDHQVRAAALPGEAKMLRVQLMTIESQAKFHRLFIDLFTQNAGGRIPFAIMMVATCGSSFRSSSLIRRRF